MDGRQISVNSQGKSDPDLDHCPYAEIALGFALESIACSSSSVLGNNGDPYNCYAYVLREDPQLVGFIQEPGSKNGRGNTANITKDELHDSIISDGGEIFEWPDGQELPNLYGTGRILVASFICSFVDPDLGIQSYWHFMRQGPFGLWYEKHGMDGRVRQVLNRSGEKVIDPREEKDFCALYILP